MKNSKFNNGAMPSVPNGFEVVKRNFEKAFASGKDYSAELVALSKAIAYSVVNKCIDPQRKTATDHDKISDNGLNPAMLDLRRGIAHDISVLDRLRDMVDKATALTYNADGELVCEIVDKAANDAVNALICQTLSDGIDLVQTASLALLEQAAEHATKDGKPVENWLDVPFWSWELDKRVYIQENDSAAHKWVETTPIQRVYRAVRMVIEMTRAAHSDPRSKYTYVSDIDADTMGTIYYRSGKYADIGGHDASGTYTGDRQTMDDMKRLIARLDLTPRQAEIVRLRLQGKGKKAIATYLGVTQHAVQDCLNKIRKKAKEIGLNPEK